MNSIKRIKHLKHFGLVIGVAALIATIPEASIALDANAASAPIETSSAIGAALDADEDYSAVTTTAIGSATANYAGVSTSIAAEAQAAKEAAEAQDAKEAAEAQAAKEAAEAQAAKETAEAQAAKEAAAKAEADAKAAAKAKKKSAKAKALTAKAPAESKASGENAKTKDSDKDSDKPAGIPDGYTVKDSFNVKAYAYSGGGGTASGKKARVGLIAVDPRVIPLGTTLYVEGYGLCIAADTGGAIKGKTIDLYMNTESECNSWGKRNVMCYILTK